MSSSVAEAKTIEVNLLGRTYRVACEDGEREALMQAVAYLDAKMNEIRKAGKVMGAERIAVMAALNVAHELLSVKLGGGYDMGQAKRRLSNIESQLDAAIAKQENLFYNPVCSLLCATGLIFSEPIASSGCGPSVTVAIVPCLGTPDEPDVTGKRPPCLARVREPSPPAWRGTSPAR